MSEPAPQSAEQLVQQARELMQQQQPDEAWKTLEASLLSEIATAGDLGAIEAVRISALGKKGRVSELMQTLGSMPGDQRKAFGAAVNALKSSVGDALEARKTVLEGAALSTRLASERADISLPVEDGR